MTSRTPNHPKAFSHQHNIVRHQLFCDPLKLDNIGVNDIHVQQQNYFPLRMKMIQQQQQQYSRKIPQKQLVTKILDTSKDGSSHTRSKSELDPQKVFEKGIQSGIFNSLYSTPENKSQHISKNMSICSNNIALESRQTYNNYDLPLQKEKKPDTQSTQNQPEIQYAFSGDGIFSNYHSNTNSVSHISYSEQSTESQLFSGALKKNSDIYPKFQQVEEYQDDKENEINNIQPEIKIDNHKLSKREKILQQIMHMKQEKQQQQVQFLDQQQIEQSQQQKKIRIQSQQINTTQNQYNAQNKQQQKLNVKKLVSICENQRSLINTPLRVRKEKSQQFIENQNINPNFADRVADMSVQSISSSCSKKRVNFLSKLITLMMEEAQTKKENSSQKQKQQQLSIQSYLKGKCQSSVKNSRISTRSQSKTKKYKEPPEIKTLEDLISTCTIEDSRPASKQKKQTIQVNKEEQTCKVRIRMKKGVIELKDLVRICNDHCDHCDIFDQVVVKQILKEKKNQLKPYSLSTQKKAKSKQRLRIRQI